MNIKELEKLFGEYKVLSIWKGISLVCVEVLLKKGFIGFDLPKKLHQYLFSLTVYHDSVAVYLNKEVLK